MKKFNLSKMQTSNKKGAVKFEGAVDVVIGLILVIALVSGTASSLFNFSWTSAGAPIWVTTVAGIVVAVIIVYLLLGLLKGSKK
jgi:hypothetical protein